MGSGKNLQETREMAAFQAAMNQNNQIGPYGSLMYTGPIDPATGYRDPTQTTATTTLSPQLQALMEQLQGNQLQFGAAAGDMMGQMNLGGPVTGGRQVPMEQVALGQVDLGREIRPGKLNLGKPLDLGRPLDLAGFNTRDFGPGAQIGLANDFRLENMLGGMNTADAFSADRDAVTDATFQRAMALLDPVYAQQDRRREQDLANRGLPMSGEAYQTDRSNTAMSRGETLNQLALDAVRAGGAEQSRLLSDLVGTSQAGLGQAAAQRGTLFGEQMGAYNANQGAALNEFNANTGAQLGQFQANTGAQLGEFQANTGARLGAFNANNQQALGEFGANTQAALGQAAANNQSALAARGLRNQEALTNRQVPLAEMMTMFQAGNNQSQPNVFAPSATGLTSYQTASVPGSGGFMGQIAPGLIQGAASLGSAALMAPIAPSDRRLKTDIRRVGQTDDGLPIYTFRYKAGGPVQMGVMAQEVAEVKPEAVGLMPDGHLGVDYGRL